MNISSLEAVLLCLAFACVSLVLVGLVNSHQNRRRLVRQKLDQMKRRLFDLEEISVSIEPLIESKSMLIYVLNEIVDLIKRIRKLEPRNPQLENNLTSAEERLDKLHANRGSTQLWRILGSDAAIARARYALNEAGRVLRKRQALGELTPEMLHGYINELSWAHCMVAAITLTGSGHQAVTRGDVLKAFAYYKNAQQALMQASHNDERRHQFIRELSEILSNQRKSISLNLMPEADYNPSANSANLVLPQKQNTAQG